MPLRHICPTGMLAGWTKMPYIYDMLSKQDLALLLQGVDVKDVAALAGVSTKSIYRMRHQAANPSLGTVEKIVAAVRTLKTPKRREKSTSTEAAA